MKKNVNLFTANLTGKELRKEKSECKKAVNSALRNYESAINAAFTQVIKSTEKRARDVANSAKGKYKTAIDVVANCFPFQTADGILCAKKKNDEGAKVWSEKKLTASAARSIVRDALKNYTNGVGIPDVTIVEIGSIVEA